MTKGLMVQGTASDAGKSLIVAGLARAFTLRGLAVRPFKPQNMSNNAAVAIEGGEIGRAQALQARACKVPPSVHMNPILLKPETDTGAQIVIRGQRAGSMTARDFMQNRQRYLGVVLESYNNLAEESDLVLVEGAGSPAEINLRDKDIANMGFAHAADLPVLLIGDIHLGGVIASIIGTLNVIPDEDRARIKAFLINKFRGDVKLFDEGVSFLETKTGLPCAGIVPYFEEAAKLPAEDAVSLDLANASGDGSITIAVPRLSRIANFDDLDPLKLEPDVKLMIVQPGNPIPADVSLILVPGTKSTIGDLKFLRKQGWDIDIKAHVRRGGRVLGICGGFQMLGQIVHDPDGFEGPPESIEGLGLLDISTILSGKKTVTDVTALHGQSGEKVYGYEIHLGQTDGPDSLRPFATISGRNDGAISLNGLVEGTYLHGIFSSDNFRRTYLENFGHASSRQFSYTEELERVLDKLAKHLEDALDLDFLLNIASQCRAESSNNALI